MASTKSSVSSEEAKGKERQRVLLLLKSYLLSNYNDVIDDASGFFTDHPLYFKAAPINACVSTMDLMTNVNGVTL